MSEEVEKTPAAPAEILPAKSEDKLIIEIEEKESEKQEDKPEEKTEEKTDVEEKDEKEESAKEEADIEAAEDKKDTADDTEKGEGEKDTEEDGKEVRARRKFKLPHVELKAPKVPAFIRNISKERKKVSQTNMINLIYFISCCNLFTPTHKSCKKKNIE